MNVLVEFSMETSVLKFPEAEKGGETFCGFMYVVVVVVWTKC